MATVCTECLDALRQRRVPPGSYVRVDEGPWPTDEHGPLPELTALEERCLAPFRVQQYVVLCRPGACCLATVFGADARGLLRAACKCI
jgi:hypothetical protein